MSRLSGNSETALRLRCVGCNKTFLHQHRCRVTGAQWKRHGLKIIYIGQLLCPPSWPVYEYDIA